MGIPGLMTFICKNDNFCLKPYELSDCILVIDGSNIAYALGNTLESHSAFGGDYDEYFSVVKNFMLGLKKCNVSPIFLFNGCKEKTKFRMELRRREDDLLKLRRFCQGFSTDIFHPLLLIEVFLNAVRDMGFMHVQCDLEVAQEIAAVARIFNCPVLSNNSNYFIYDAMFIPFNKMQPMPVKPCHTSEYYMKCSIYKNDDFLKATGLDKPLLYVLVVILSNDFGETDMFLEFFHRIGIPYTKKNSWKKFTGLIQWLKNENLNSALNYIISCLTEKDAKRFSELFNLTKNFYSTCCISKSLSGELINKFGRSAGPYLLSIQLRKSVLDANWPSEIALLHSQTLIPGFLVNMVRHQIYFTKLQVENLFDQSSHVRFMNLIRAIYALLPPYVKAKKPLQVYIVVNREYRCVKVDADLSNCINLHEVLKQSWEKRLELLCDTIGVHMNDLKFVPCNSWAIVMLTFTHWAKEFNNSLSLAHIQAFVIMIIANQIVQSKVGYYRNDQEFVKRHGDEIEKLKDMTITLKKSSNFKEMLSNVKLHECLLVQKALIPLRQTPDVAVSNYSLRTVHLYNCFQTSLFYIMIINALLNHPLPHLRVQDYYSGTLLFNLYVHITSKSSVEEFGSALFLHTPNLNQIYKYLSVKLLEILKKTAGVNIKSRGIK